MNSIHIVSHTHNSWSISHYNNKYSISIMTFGVLLKNIYINNTCEKHQLFHVPFNTTHITTIWGNFFFCNFCVSNHLTVSNFFPIYGIHVMLVLCLNKNEVSQPSSLHVSLVCSWATPTHFSAKYLFYMHNVYFHKIHFLIILKAKMFTRSRNILG